MIQMKRSIAAEQQLIDNFKAMERNNEFIGKEGKEGRIEDKKIELKVDGEVFIL